MNLTSPYLQYSVADLTVEKILSCVMKVLQSKDEIKLDSGFVADVISIRRDRGAGRRRVVNIDVDRLRKKAILSIPSDEEGLCCAKAIVFAKAHLLKDQRAINGLRDRRRPTLLNAARKLHEDANVPLGPCSYSEIQKFEDYLDIQIVVFSTQNLNKVSSYVFVHRFSPLLHTIYICTSYLITHIKN